MDNPLIKQGDEIMRITVYHNGEDVESIDLNTVLFVHANCNPVDYAPAFAEIMDRLRNQFIVAMERIRAQQN